MSPEVDYSTIVEMLAIDGNLKRNYGLKLNNQNACLFPELMLVLLVL